MSEVVGWVSKFGLEEFDKVNKGNNILVYLKEPDSSYVKAFGLRKVRISLITDDEGLWPQKESTDG